MPPSIPSNHGVVGVSSSSSSPRTIPGEETTTTTTAGLGGGGVRRGGQHQRRPLLSSTTATKPISTTKRANQYGTKNSKSPQQSSSNMIARREHNRRAMYDDQRYVTPDTTTRRTSSSPSAFTPTASQLPPSQQQEEEADNAVEATAATTATATTNNPVATTSTDLYSPSPYSAYGGAGGLGMGMGGMGMGGIGMMSPYGGMYGGYGMGYGGGVGFGPLSGLNQFLFGVQNIIFSLGQAVQIIGMNTAAIKQLGESALAMFEHAVATWHEMQVLEKQSYERESEEDRKRRRRLRALRWAIITATTYAGYKLIRKVFFERITSDATNRNNNSRLQQHAASQYPQQHPNPSGTSYYSPSNAIGNYSPYDSMTTLSSPYYGNNYNTMNPYSGSYY